MRVFWRSRQPRRPKVLSPPPPSPPYLPPELIFEIIAHLQYRSDREDLTYTLASLALVSSAFRGPAQAALFHSIHVDTSPSQRSRTEALSKVLQSRPSLNRFVQELEIGIHASSDSSNSLGTFPRLECMHSLRVRCTAGRGGIVFWHSLPKALQRQLCAMIQSSTTRTLSLQNISAIPTHIISTCAQLRELTVSGRTYFDLEPVPAASRPATAKMGYLEKLNLEQVMLPASALVRALCDKNWSSALSLQCLRTLSVDIWCDAQLKDCRAVLDVSGEIEKLKLNVYHPLTAPLGSLESLRHVRSLELRPSTVEVFLSLFPILESFPTVHRLREVTIHMNLWAWARMQSSNVGVWAQRVDELLSRERTTLHRLGVLLVAVVYDKAVGVLVVEKVSPIVGAKGPLGYG